MESIIVSGIAAFAAFGSMIFSWRMTLVAKEAKRAAETANKISSEMVDLAKESNNITKQIFRRSQALELRSVWRGVNEILPDNLVGPDVIKALEAMDATATAWNHDIVEREIILQSHWVDFRDLYDALYGCSLFVPGKKKTCRQHILDAPQITTAYEAMKAESAKKTITSEV